MQTDRATIIAAVLQHKAARFVAVVTTLGTIAAGAWAVIPRSPPAPTIQVGGDSYIVGGDGRFVAQSDVGDSAEELKAIKIARRENGRRVLDEQKRRMTGDRTASDRAALERFDRFQSRYLQLTDDAIEAIGSRRFVLADELNKTIILLLTSKEATEWMPPESIQFTTSRNSAAWCNCRPAAPSFQEPKLPQSRRRIQRSLLSL